MIYTAVLVILGLFAGTVYALVRANEEKKAEQLVIDRRLRQRYDAAMNVYPPRAAGTHHQPWKDRRVS